MPPNPLNLYTAAVEVRFRRKGASRGVFSDFSKGRCLSLFFLSMIIALLMKLICIQTPKLGMRMEKQKL